MQALMRYVCREVSSVAPLNVCAWTYLCVLQTLIAVRWRLFETFQVLRAWVEAVRGVTGTSLTLAPAY